MRHICEQSRLEEERRHFTELASGHDAKLGEKSHELFLAIQDNHDKAVESTSSLDTKLTERLGTLEMRSIDTSAKHELRMDSVEREAKGVSQLLARTTGSLTTLESTVADHHAHFTDQLAAADSKVSARFASQDQRMEEAAASAKW